jgi:uncharacterized SAM-binding protein YcdF (DUF218 family)
LSFVKKWKLADRAARADLKSVLPVTSACRMRRSLWTFEKVLENNNVQIGIVSPIDEQTPPPFLWWLTTKGWKLRQRRICENRILLVKLLITCDDSFYLK